MELRLEAGVFRGSTTAVLAAIAALAFAPATEAKKKPKTPKPIDVTQFEWSSATGTNTVAGEATCAGLAVSLLPATAYTDRFADKTFGSTESGTYAPSPRAKRRVMAPEVTPFVRTQLCDSQGRFLFTDLPDGPYYVIAHVTRDGADQGLQVLRRVEVRNGHRQELSFLE
jgi:hypothetical protein